MSNVFREDYALFPVMLNLMPIDADDMLFVEASEYGYSFLDEATIHAFRRQPVQAIPVHSAKHRVTASRVAPAACPLRCWPRCSQPCRST